MAGKSKNMIGLKYGSITVLKEVDSQNLLIHCQCGNEYIIKRANISGYKEYQGCFACYHSRRKTKNTLCSKIWYAIKSNARSRNIAFDELNLTREFLWQFYLKQNKQCFLSGLSIYLRESDTDTAENTASLDRIDSSKGYEVGNIQWIHKDINRMKSTISQSRFLELCSEISINN